MRRLFLSHVLGAWLLLSQLPRELSGQKPDDVIKACGRELARLRIEICGSLSWKKTVLRLEEPGLEAGQPIEIVSSSISKDAEALNTMLGLNSNLPKEQKATLSERQPSWRELQQPALKDSNLNLEEFKETILKRQSEVEDDSLSELKNLGLDKHSRKKRMIQLSHKCCYWGCTRKELARQC
ncbi:prorelaxin H1 isoform X1 [Equus asinus]|uniref:Insulin-like domain-containing protein n=2 Tax=Equus asinus TaxID=9793 RepID=A0A8C4PLU1_EQUAS|nr:prorelaxin isoform X1 [Equus asinus]